MKEYSYIKRALLRELSENSRISVTDLAKKLKCSRNTVISNIAFLEDEFGLQYTLEFDREKIGFVQTQVLSIDFGMKPSIREMKEIFLSGETAKHISFLACTSGDFDVVIKVTTSKQREYQAWAFKLWIKLLKYRPRFKISILDNLSLGFMRLSSAIIEGTDFEVLGLDELDKKLILLLNENSRITYRAVAKKLGEPVETINYRFKKIEKCGLISGYTIILKRAPTDYNMFYFTNYEPSPGMVGRLDNWLEFVLELDGKLPILNSFQYMAGLIGYYSGAGICCFENEEKAIKYAILMPQEIMREDNLTVTHAKIDSVLIGNLPIRNIDVEKKLGAIKQQLDELKKYLKE